MYIDFLALATDPQTNVGMSDNRSVGLERFFYLSIHNHFGGLDDFQSKMKLVTETTVLYCINY